MTKYESILLQTAKAVKNIAKKMNCIAKERGDDFVQHQTGGMLSKLNFAIILFEEDGADAYRMDAKTLNSQYIVEQTCKAIQLISELSRLE